MVSEIYQDIPKHLFFDAAIVLNLEDVQRQQGYSDCGLFAVAFATSLCGGEDPTKISYVQHSLRSHLISCRKDVSISKTGPATKEKDSARKETVPVLSLSTP